MIERDPDDGFDLVWAQVDEIGGWLTREQAGLLWERARRLGPRATVVEIGSHQGRSTCVLASAVKKSSGRVVAIDPFVEGKLFGGASTRSRFEANLARVGVTDVVDLVVARSGDSRPGWHSPIDLLYIDGKHDYWTVSDDLRWIDHCRPHAPILIHDAFSSVGVTSGLIHHVLYRGSARYVGRVGSLALFHPEPPTADDRRRFLAELPWWVRNVAVKIALRARARPLARALGHDDVVDPY